MTLANGATIARDNGTLQSAPTLSGVINVDYFGASTITTGIELPGTTNQLSSLIMNKIGMATVTLDKNVTVNGALTLTGGSLITTAAFRIFVAATGTSTGSAASFVIGTIQKTFGAPPDPAFRNASEKLVFGAIPNALLGGGSNTFVYFVGTASGYSPATINVDSGVGSFTVSPATGIISGSGLDPAKTLARYWSLTASGISQADIAFQYPQADVPGGAVESQFKFVRNTGDQIIHSSLQPA
ncbi:MAG: hypothetical protein IPG58_13610 [Acidobacteria bacterium]|nr:hypothetical protein [Acidobacteriota bacterium]